MSGLEDLRRELAEIHLTLKASVEDIEKLLEEILEVGRSLNLTPEKRAEGYALTPSHNVAILGLPHLRIARIGDLLTIWVRAPYALDEERCRLAGISAEELHQKLLAGAIRIAEILRKHSEKGEFLQISLPQ